MPIINESKNFNLVAAMPAALLLVALNACVNNQPPKVVGVYDDGSPIVAGSGLSSGLDEKKRSEEVPGISQYRPKSEVKNYIVEASSLNIRSGPGTDFDVIGTLHRSEQVEGIPSNELKWLKIREKAFVSMRYLEEVELTSKENQSKS